MRAMNAEPRDPAEVVAGLGLRPQGRPGASGR